MIEAVRRDVGEQVDRAEIADGDFVPEVFSRISVQRLEECTTPACCWGERRLHGSLKVIQGWPVSKSMVSILRQRSSARTVLEHLDLAGAALASYSA